jgi:Cdc6-like AAA superfamily ATPase
MRYQALADEQYIDAPQLNIFASRLDADLTAVLEGYVLPHRLPNQPTYTQKDAQLYVARRDWIADIPLKVEGPLTFRYERAMHEILWRSENHPEYKRKKLIFLTGTVGCGKSTLVDYYFRCFCPGLPPAKNRYSKKLVIHVDLKGTNTMDDIFSRFIADVQISLRMRNKLHADFVQVLKSILPYREKLMELLRAIAGKIRGTELGETKHLILCVDNIDQSPLEIQKVVTCH